MSHAQDPDAAAREALRLIGPDPRNWVPDRPGIDHNVAIIGGGQTGCAFAFALRRAGIGKVAVLDAAADEEQAGIWLRAARMNLLRTPKSLPGPELGIPALGFQAWYEARHGAAAYAAIDRIPRLDWAAYLRWFRHFLAIPVRYRTEVTRIEPAEGHFRLHLTVDGVATVETTRKVILANGFTGNGGPFIPSALTDGLPADRYSHTEDAIDFAALRGRTVAVIGAAASAFDAAGVALESGAAAVHLFARRSAIAATPITRSRGFPGAYDNYYDLPEEIRWHQAVRFREAGSTPTTDAITRAVAFPNFHLHLGVSWDRASVVDGRIEARVANRAFTCDHVIAGTGYFVDPSARPELADFADDILLWRDRFVPPPEEADVVLGMHPYLGAGHEYLEKRPGRTPFLRDIHVQNPAGYVSFGLPIGDVPSMRRDVPVVTARISRDLFLADLDIHDRRMRGEVKPDFGPELYATAVR
jgi:cation diffusion facilitator CzcD-associated flavoprotein CzcO